MNYKEEGKNKRVSARSNSVKGVFYLKGIKMWKFLRVLVISCEFESEPVHIFGIFNTERCGNNYFVTIVGVKVRLNSIVKTTICLRFHWGVVPQIPLWIQVRSAFLMFFEGVLSTTAGGRIYYYCWYTYCRDFHSYLSIPI